MNEKHVFLIKTDGIKTDGIFIGFQQTENDKYAISRWDETSMQIIQNKNKASHNLNHNVRFHIRKFSFVM